MAVAFNTQIMIENLLQNNFVSIYIISGVVCIITGYYIKSYFYSTVIETPNSPPTFNFNNEQIKEIQAILDKGDKLDKEKQEQLDQDFRAMLGDENYAEFTAEIEEIDLQMTQEISDLFNNLF